MKRVEMTYLSSEDRTTDSGVDKYNLFVDINGKRLAIKSNRVLNHFGNLIKGETYFLFIDITALKGIQHKDRLVFLWAGRILMSKGNEVYELNSTMKKSLTYEKIVEYKDKFTSFVNP